MRETDLAGIPQAITRGARDQLLAACGITELDQLASFEMSYRGITAVVYATDEAGRRILDDGNAAKYEIFIPFTGDSVGDSLPEWLFYRFNISSVTKGDGGAAWQALTSDDRELWVHEADAVRRAVVRSGFKSSREIKDMKVLSYGPTLDGPGEILSVTPVDGDVT